MELTSTAIAEAQRLETRRKTRRKAIRVTFHRRPVGMKAPDPDALVVHSRPAARTLRGLPETERGEQDSPVARCGQRMYGELDLFVKSDVAHDVARTTCKDCRTAGESWSWQDGFDAGMAFARATALADNLLAS